MRNRSNIGDRGQKTIRGHYLFVVFCLIPSAALAGNGDLGGISIATSQLTIVVPEHFEPTDVRVKDGKLATCGNFSDDFAFLSINGDSVEMLKPITGESDCKTGQMFVLPNVLEGPSIIVPSSVF